VKSFCWACQTRAVIPYSGVLPTHQGGLRISPVVAKAGRFLAINLDEKDCQAHPPLDQWPGLFGYSRITFAMCAEERNYELFYLSKNILLKDRFSP
jgi:hypothetical protein